MIISTRIGGELTDSQHRSFINVVSGNDKKIPNAGDLEVIIKAGTTNTIQVKPGISIVSGCICEETGVIEKTFQNPSTSGLYYAIQRIDFSQTPATGTTMFVLSTTQLYNDDLVDNPHGKRDFKIAQFNVSTTGLISNLVNVKATPANDVLFKSEGGTITGETNFTDKLQQGGHNVMTQQKTIFSPNINSVFEPNGLKEIFKIGNMVSVTLSLKPKNNLPLGNPILISTNELPTNMQPTSVLHWSVPMFAGHTVVGIFAFKIENGSMHIVSADAWGVGGTIAFNVCYLVQ